MRRNSPRTKRADDVRRFAVMYDDARNAPKTAEDHEKDAYGSTCLTAAEARRILGLATSFWTISGGPSLLF